MLGFLAPMAGFLNPVGNFLKRIPDWIIWLLAAIVFLKFVDMNAEGRGRKKQKQEDEVEGLKTVNKVIGESSNDADEADAARAAAPSVESPDELSIETQRRVFRDQ